MVLDRMPFAVTCRSCGARFSIADELYRRRFAGRLVMLRCRRCHAIIRLQASEPPAPLTAVTDSTPPLGETDDAELTPSLPRARRPLPRPPPARGSKKPRPPDLGVQSSNPTASEPPSRPPVSSSGVPPLASLTREVRESKPGASADLDFLVGLSAGVGTDAALLSAPVAAPPLDPSVPESHVTELKPAAPRLDPNEPRVILRPSADDTVRIERAPSASAPSASAPSLPVPERHREYAARRRSPALAVSVLLLLGTVAALAVFLLRSQPEEPLAAAVSTESLQQEPAPPRSLAEETAAPEPSAAAAGASVQSPNPPATSIRRRAARDESTPRVLGADSAAAAAESAPAPGPSVSAPAEPAETAEPLERFDREAAASALSSAASDASSCRKPGDPSGLAQVTVTFAPSGRVTSANLSGPPFAGTATGGCIAATLRRARVPAFAGDKVTVSKTVVIQ